MEPQYPIWIPGALGQVDAQTWRISVALREYDERLVLARNEDNGQWCVFMRMPRGGDWPELYPVFGLTEPPHDPRTLEVRDVMRRVINADTARQGQKILDDIVRTNHALSHSKDAAAQAATANLAEVAASAMMRAGTAPVSSTPVRRYKRSERWDGG
jgi:hypothetical protein